MKIATAFLASALLVSTAQAGSTEPWPSAELQDDIVSEKVIGTGYISNEGRFRLEKLAPEMTISTYLESDYAKSYGLEEFKNTCFLNRESHRLSRARKRVFTVRVKIPFLSRRHYRVVSENKSRLLLANEQSIRLIGLSPKLRFSDNSYLMLYGQIDPQKILNDMYRQLEDQLPDVRATGEVTLSFAGLDDMACDFVNNRVELGFETSWDFQPALAARTTQVTATQLENIQNRAIQLQLDSKDSLNLVLSAGRVGVALRDETRLDVDTFGNQNFVALHALLFDTRSNNWTPKIQDTASEARNFDRLERKLVVQKSIVKIQFSGGLQ